MTYNNDLTLTAVKKAAGEAGALLVQQGMLLGLGTGSTAVFFIEALGRRCKEGLNIRAVATSERSRDQAEKLGIPLEDEQNISYLDLTIDGADEIDPQKNMIKGGGGALFREKLLAISSKEMIVLVDETKLVPHLGVFPVPVEISPFIYRATISRLHDKGYDGIIRRNHDSSIYVTDNGNYIIDLRIERPILNPKKDHEDIRSIEGVIETGLFFDVAGRVIIGYKNGSVKIQA